MDRERISDDLKPLMKAVSTIYVSTSECERNYSVMNNIMAAKRSSLGIPTVASLLFISLVGPPMNQLEPTKYVKSWLAKDDVQQTRQLVLNEKQAVTVIIMNFCGRICYDSFHIIF
jgi:hypothetical protein